jgi:hypothetical protein
VFACSSFYAGVANVTPSRSLWGHLSACSDRLGIKKPKSPTATHDHNPQNDAETIAYEAAAIVRSVDASEDSKKVTWEHFLLEQQKHKGCV